MKPQIGKPFTCVVALVCRGFTCYRPACIGRRKWKIKVPTHESIMIMNVTETPASSNMVLLSKKNYFLKPIISHLICTYINSI